MTNAFDSLTEQQKAAATAVKALLADQSESGVARALMLLETGGDRGVARALAVGISVEFRALTLEPSALRDVPKPLRAAAALGLAKVAGLLDSVDSFTMVVRQHERQLDTKEVSLRVFEGLPQLRSLEVRDRAPADLRELEGCISLERLEIDGLEPGALDVPINLPRTIRELSLSGIGCFACLDLSSLDALESIDAHDCALGFARMSGGRMEKLRSVSVTSKLSFTLADLTALPNLEELSLVGCRELETLALFAQPSLRKVAISDAPALESIAPLCSPAARIRELELCQLPRLTDLTPLAELPNLEVLELRNVGPRSLGTRSWPSSLREVTLADSPALHEVGALAGAAHLDKLSISACGVDRLPELPDVGEVDASDCPHLRDVSALASCRYLHTLSLDGCRSFVDVPSLLTLRNLEDLDLRGTAITNVAPLAALTSLRRLRVPAAVAGQLAALREALPNCRCV